VLSAEATSTVAEITSVYFLAGAVGGAAPAYADVLLETPDASGPPFTAASLATMEEGETRTVGAIGEDDLGNRTVLVLASITRAVDTGEAAGTPGTFVLTFHTAPAAVAREVDAAVDEPVAFKPMRKSVNASKVTQARIEAGVHVAASLGTRAVLVYSTNRFVTYAEAGPWVRVDRVKFPETGDYIDLEPGAAADGIMWGLATKSGDGSTVVKVGNVYIEAVGAISGTAPDAPPISVPDSDLKFDFRAELITGVVSGNRFTPWNNEVVGGDDASAETASVPDPTVGPKYEATGLPNGTPAVDFDTLGKHFEFDHGMTTGNITEYIAAQFVEGVGSSADWYLNGSILDAKQFSISGKHGITLRADGKITCGWETTTAITSASYIDGTVRVICFQRNASTGAFALYDETNAVIASGTGTTGGTVGLYAMLGMNYVTLDNIPARIKYGRVMGYEAIHDATTRATIIAAFIDLYV
jgi:hypothetical protein